MSFKDTEDGSVVVAENHRLLEVDIKRAGNFPRIRETLERVGESSGPGRTLLQVCHILHRRKRYFIVHYKEMLLADDAPDVKFSDVDFDWRNCIAGYLHEWGLLEIVHPDERAVCKNLVENKVPKVKVLPHADRDDWNLVARYKMGSQKRKVHDGP